MLYVIEDTVETGHAERIGGSISIKIYYEKILSEEERDNVLKIIDYLDHTLITYNKNYINISKRFFLVKDSGNLLMDVIGILNHFITDALGFEVSLRKETLYIERFNNFEIEDYCLEG